MCFRQQWLSIGQYELLVVAIKYNYLLEGAIEVGDIVSRVLGILAVVVYLVAVLQQLGVPLCRILYSLRAG